ncbi:MAG: DUF4352 domain-containing protein [Patescibacteria group bacterium]
MDNKKCKYCQTEIDKKARICPNCKKDQRGWFGKHPIIWTVVIFFLFLIILNPAGRLANKSGSTSDKTSETTKTDKETTVEDRTKSAKLNEDLQVGEVKWKVLKAWKADQLYDYSGTVKPAGKFLVVNVTVENMGKDMKTVTGLKVVDDQGREFTTYSKSFGLKNLGAESLYVLSNINPNVPLTFADVYEIPADAKSLKLKVGDLSLFGGSEGLIDLGL